VYDIAVNIACMLENNESADELEAPKLTEIFELYFMDGHPLTVKYDSNHQWSPNFMKRRFNDLTSTERHNFINSSFQLLSDEVQTENIQTFSLQFTAPCTKEALVNKY
jgi:hypothetical protein